MQSTPLEGCAEFFPSHDTIPGGTRVTSPQERTLSGSMNKKEMEGEQNCWLCQKAEMEGWREASVHSTQNTPVLIEFQEGTVETFLLRHEFVSDERHLQLVQTDCEQLRIGEWIKIIV